MAIVVFSGIASAFEAVGAVAIFGLVAGISNPQGLFGLPVIGSVLEHVSGDRPSLAILYFALGSAGLFAVKNAFVFYQTLFQERCAVDSLVTVGSNLLAVYLRAPYEFHFGRNSAELIRKIEDHVEIAFRTVLLSAAVIVSEGLTLLALLVVLLATEPVATLATGLFLGGVMAAILATLQRRFGLWGEQRLRVTRVVLQTIQQSLGSIKETKVLGRENYFIGEFAKAVRGRGIILCKAAAFSQAPRLIVETLMVFGMLLIVVLVSANRDMAASVPVLGLFAYVGFRVMPSVNRLIMNLNNVRYGAAAVRGVREDFDRLGAADPGTDLDPDEHVVAFSRAIELSAVSYVYPGTELPAVSEVSAVIPRGRMVGIAGPTGAGKSTLADLILGLLHPTSGRVTVDGHDIVHHTRAWQRHIGYVPQSIYLSDESIARNIAIGRHDREIDPEAVREAARMAQILDFVESLPDGFDTVVGERGVRLSGGQRQRLGIARALYQQPDVIVFDEATSALDNETEAEVARAIDDLAGAKTVVMIAHRLSTLRKCDSILFLRGGRLVANGSYQELMEASAEFRQMVAAGQGSDHDLI